MLDQDMVVRHEHVVIMLQQMDLRHQLTQIVIHGYLPVLMMLVQVHV